MLAVSGAVGAAIKWTYEYSNKLKWEKNKFLLEQIEKFQSDPNTQTMELILDWNRCNIVINETKIEFDDDLFYHSLATHDKVHKFTKEELLLRGLFDDYFDSLTKLIILADSGMVSESNLKLFLSYWFKILSGESSSKSQTIIDQIRSYLQFYGYDRLLEFLEKHY